MDNILRNNRDGPYAPGSSEQSSLIVNRYIFKGLPNGDVILSRCHSRRFMLSSRLSQMSRRFVQIHLSGARYGTLVWMVFKGSECIELGNGGECSIGTGSVF